MNVSLVRVSGHTNPPRFFLNPGRSNRPVPREISRSQRRFTSDNIHFHGVPAGHERRCMRIPRMGKTREIFLAKNGFHLKTVVFNI